MGLRDLYDQLEKVLAPAAAEFTHSEDYAKLAAVVAGLNKFAQSTTNDVAARFWHVLNLPAGTDVQRLRNQVGALDREIRLLSMELERNRATEVKDGPAAPRNPRPRTKRS